MLAELQRTLGVPLAGATATAAGNQVVELADPVDAATARQFANALRLRGDVVWAEIERGTGVRAATHQGGGGRRHGQRRRCGG